MVFSSITFLVYFLPFTICVYFLLQNKYRNYFLLIMSLIFYAWGSPQYSLVMIGVIVINYVSGLFIDKYDVRGNLKAKKRVLIIGIILNMGILFVFKYTNFFVYNINFPLQWLGMDPIFMKNIVLPIGISFYIFQSMSYIIDVYKKDAPVQKKFSNLALYVSMFPQLVAGPIVRYNTIAEQINSERTIPLDKIALGLRIFIIGLGKKVLLANSMGGIPDMMFSLNPSELSMLDSWLGAIGYTLQIYFDFSGYSDMAIGLGIIFGFTFPVNFNYPYISTSITEFWRRWHISLSTWFKDYLYIPLGGNRVKVSRMYVNLGIVFLATGFWHGANWTFVIWGMVHGFFLVLEKITGWHKIERFKIVRWAVTMLICIFAWVIFRSDNMAYALGYMKAMIGLNGFEEYVFDMKYVLTLTNISVLVVAIFSAFPLFKRYFLNSMLEADTTGVAVYKKLLIYCFIFGVMILSLARLAGSSFNPFIYFRF